MSLALNIANQIDIFYQTFDKEKAFEKTLELVQRELTFTMDATHVATLKDVRDSIRVSINTLDKCYQEREKIST